MNILIDEFNLFSKKIKIDLYIFSEGKKELIVEKINDYGLSRVFLKGYSDDIYFHMKNSKTFIFVFFMN